jgi:hypothetical protein
MDFKITFDVLPLLGALLSLAGFYLPGFKGWYETLASQTKQLFNIGVVALVALAVWGLGFTGQVDVYQADLAGLWAVLVDVIFAIVVNAGVYKGTNYIGTGR